MLPTPYVASLRIYEPLSAFSPAEALRWSAIPTTNETNTEEQTRALTRIVTSEPPALKPDGAHLLEIDGNLISAHPEFAELSQVANDLDVSVFDLILSGGEDHCFLATGVGLKGYEIGKVAPGIGIRLLSVATPQPGWNHFK